MIRFVLLAVVVLSLMLPAPALAQDTIRVLDEGVEAHFRDHITFRITVEGDQPIQEARLFYRVTGLPATARGDAEFTPATRIETSFRIDQTRDYLPPGSEISYWWRITNAAGDTLKTEPQSYRYMDDRHNWQTLSNERLMLYWYRGDQDFGDALFSQANRTLDLIETEAGVRVERQVQIFIYGSHRDLMDAIDVGAQEWTGGQAFTKHGVVVINVSPNDLEFGLIAVPHELTHIVIDHATDNPYGDIPRWLDEGLAVYMSGELDVAFRGYRDMVAAYARQNQLMTLQTLSSSFPADSQQANQAYAQSGLVVEYIIHHYGKDAMAKLLQIFAEGSTYDDALEQALGVDTWGLDNAWRESISAAPIEIPAGATTPARGAPADTATVTPAPTATASGATPTATAITPTVAATPTDTAPTPTSRQTGDGRRLPCLSAGLVGVAVLVFFATTLRARGV
jgi:hypothetical protein